MCTEVNPITRVGIQHKQEGIKKFAGADGAPRSCVCTRTTLCSAPHQHQWKLFRAHDPMQNFITTGKLLLGEK